MGIYVPLYRAVALCVSLVWLWGLNIWTWSRYRVNHVFIFEISPRHKVNHLEIWAEAASLSIVVLLNSLLFLHHQQYRLKARLSEVVYPLALIAFIIAKIALQLSDSSKRGSLQKDIVASMGSVFIAPFGRARFRDCYLADYFCSMQKIFSDLQYIICIYTLSFSKLMQDDPLASSGYCLSLGSILVPIVHAVPYWWRFQQCLHRYIETQKRWPNLANAFKYCLCQLTVIIGSLHPFFSEYQAPWSPYRLFWLALIVVTTLYTYVWDLVMDWGLLQFQDKAHPLLRQNRLFPTTTFYYWAMCSNLVLRFTWVVTLIPFPFQSVLASSAELENVLLPLLTFLELFRRSQWGILRVEYEHLSTSQGFRKYEHLPLYFDKAGPTAAVGLEPKKKSIWINLEVVFMAGLLVFFSVVVWVLK
uniref:EXS domain-containing protein n=1 Tax=Lotharella oceanica TaxID=641309 RepID=A0A7S2TPH6_9EUKA|eukprot:CAMPEP_0170185924 /NCGR_PEP_ID=MMETSP0040_2-20121228/37835_1 /TAXON_ID=641309 /ORGANISM="Lotharella oceanica, Strain CCMP622" /LENGTH=416 /DNA_ID=CAMNT_0010432479 /DNA_START=81 /DNA_END=1331 /DNA_ORIENTATION=+